MRWCMFNLILLICFTRMSAEEIQADSSVVSPSHYDKRVAKYHQRWDALIPTQFIIQNAGNMGKVSMGLGWDYGKRNQWETHVLFGLIPKHESTRAKLTMTIKETFIPWQIDLKGGWDIEPLTTGAYLNTVFGHEFWGHQPSRYPDSYYDFLSTKARINVFLGQRVTWMIPDKKRKTAKSITAFYELSTCDLYVRAMVVDHYIKPKDIVGLSLGLKFQFM